MRRRSKNRPESRRLRWRPGRQSRATPAKKEKRERKRSLRPKKRSHYSKKVKVHHDDVVYGYDFDDGDEISMNQIIGEMGEVVVVGKVIRLEERLLRSGKTIMIFDLTDFTDTITVKMFIKPEMLDEVREFLRMGAFVKAQGDYQH